jgi:hypothetical protein
MRSSNLYAGMALRSLVRLRKIPAGNHGIRPASTKACLRSRGRRRWLHVQPASKVTPGYQKPIRHRAWTSKRAILGETDRPIPRAPNAQDRSKSHVSSASRPAIFMRRSRRCEGDKQLRNSGTPTHLGPASKAPTPRRSAAVDCAAHAIGVMSKPACNMSSRRSQSTSCQSHPGQTERHLPRRAAPTSRLSNSVPREFATTVNLAVTRGKFVPNLPDSTECCHLGPSQHPANLPPGQRCTRRLDAVYR